MKTINFIDNSLFRPITKNESAFLNFNISICNEDLLSGNNRSLDIRMTPFTVMEALNITVPNIKVTIDNNTFKNCIDFISELKIRAEESYEGIEVLSNKNFKEKAISYRHKILQNSLELYDSCIFNPLSDENFEIILRNSLLYEYMYKYNYRKACLNDIIEISKKLENLYHSRFRLCKVVWDKKYQKVIENNTSIKTQLKSLKNSIKLKNDHDYIDCEMIHKLIFGDFINGELKNINAFTCEKPERIINRIKLYKTFLNYTNCDIYKKSNELQGKIVFFNDENYSIDSIVKIEDIKELANEFNIFRT